ncbi:hypothetical protein CCACVL1_02916, partial [Corchorus capsularis]
LGRKQLKEKLCGLPNRSRLNTALKGPEGPE